MSKRSSHVDGAGVLRTCNKSFIVLMPGRTTPLLVCDFDGGLGYNSTMSEGSRTLDHAHGDFHDAAQGPGG